MSSLADRLIGLQGRSQKNIRNICILAHVDHGKTTLADALVASNGLISQRLAGQLRYMDSRPDEQERGITMKSSAVTLACDEHLINLIDSPGHVDFSSEVSTAVRLCDGAIIVVDVVEGVQPQTEVVLKQAWLEGIRPVLVLNKIDRLITETKLTPLDAYVKIGQVLEAVNAVIGQLFASDVMKKNEDNLESGLEDADDSDLYFSPDRGNVIFASAYDGWAFDLDLFAGINAEKLGFSQDALRKTLWGDYYVNTKTKMIVKGAAAKAKKPLFVSLILDNLWTLYDAILVQKDSEKIAKIVDFLKIKVPARDMRTNDAKQKLSAIFSQWLPLAKSLLKMVISQLPSPKDVKEERAEQLMCSKTTRFDYLPAATRSLKSEFLACDPDSDQVIVFVSKMFPVPKKQLPMNRPRTLTPEEMAKRREAAKQRLLAKQENSLSQDVQELQLEEKDLDGTAFVAFARVFSGTLKPGQDLYVLGPKYNPRETLDRINSGETIVVDESATLASSSQSHIMKAKIGQLYLLLGREMEELQEARAGNIVGIGGLEEYILKSATLSTNLACTPFVEITHSAAPILRVAVEPEKSTDLPALVRGLHLLNQADANVQVHINDKGEHILVTAGEVHLQRCLRDLEETYAGVVVNASSPIVPFRETIIEPPETDMVNEEYIKPENEEGDKDKTVFVQTPNKQCSLAIKALPMPEAAVKILVENSELLKSDDRRMVIMNNDLPALVELQSKLREVFKSDEKHKDDFVDCVKNIISFGPRRQGPNILVNQTGGSCCQLENWKESIINGFQLATLAGPLCEEPLHGVAFLLKEFNVVEVKAENDLYGPLSGQIVSTIKDGCRRAFQVYNKQNSCAVWLKFRFDFRLIHRDLWLPCTRATSR